MLQRTLTLCAPGRESSPDSTVLNLVAIRPYNNKGTKVQTPGAVAGAWPVAWVCGECAHGLGYATRSAT